VVGDLMLDVVLRSDRGLETGTDIPGSVSFVQGGSAATTARWLGRLGANVTLVTSVGRDPAGRSLVDAIRGDNVRVRAARVAGVRTGRIGVVVGPAGERSFVADRGAADRLRPEDVQASWLARVDALHLPVYSLLGHPLGCAPHAVVTRGAKGATVMSRDGSDRLRFEVATEHLQAADTTGAGDAFDAGFLVGWFGAIAAGRALPATMRHAAVAGHKAAARQLSTPRPELPLG
jgi:sugar/nucleoside kinase (ribokinase family)